MAALVSGKAGERQGVVSTHAAAMTLQHGLKIIAFGMVGFSFVTWLGLMGAMIISGYAGTVIGGKILHMMDETLFRKIFKYLLTGLSPVHAGQGHHAFRLKRLLILFCFIGI